MSKLGIVLEGGGARGAYTGGVLVWFLEHNIPVDYINGISAGAYTALNYVSKQPERMEKICTQYLASSRYAGWGAIVHEHSLAGLDYMFEYVSEHEPIDWEAYNANPVEFEFGLFNCESGEVEYFNKNDAFENFDLLKASCRLPGFTSVGHINDKYYLDGGVRTMIPIDRAEEVGIDYNIVILTKVKEYVRKPEPKWELFLLKFFIGKFPKVLEFLRRRHIEFAEEVEHIYKNQEEGKGLVLRPSVDLGVGRMCKDPVKLKEMWDLGFKDCEEHKEEIMALVKRAKGDS